MFWLLFLRFFAREMWLGLYNAKMGIYLTKVTPTSCGFKTSGATWDLTKDL